jgi:hypothetical protein
MVRFGLWICSVLLVTTAAQAGEAKITILAKELAFNWSGHRLSVGMPGDDFQKVFGAPDNTLDFPGGVTGLNYLSRGVGVAVKNGQVFAVDFFMQDQNGAPEPDEQFKSADASTDQGVGAASTADNVIEAYGTPTKDQKFAAMGEFPSMRTLRYDTKGGHFQFFFKADKLDHISIIADPTR